MTFEELLEDARTIPKTELRESVLRFLTQPRRQPTYDEIQYGKTLAAQALERGASMTPDEVTLNKIRERQNRFVPTDPHGNT